jgi:hemerythrin-like metal-binding protein
MHQEHIAWLPSYNIGIEDIDFQHHYFLNLINRLAKEFKRSDNLSFRVSLVSELSAYTRFHFISEENMMLRSGYPETETHKQHHRQLLDQLSSKQALLEVRRTEQSFEDILEFLVNWFMHHTGQEDKLFANYLHGQPDGNPRVAANSGLHPDAA